MKKLSFVLAVAAMFAVTLSSCASKGGMSGPGLADLDIPHFMISPPKAGEMVYGIGSAKMSTMNMSITMADNRSRVSISQKLSSDVQNMIDDFSSEVEGDKTTAINYAQSVSRTLSEYKLLGTEVQERYVAKDGTVYTLMGFSFAAAEKLANDALAFNQKKAEYAAVRNMVAQDQMAEAFAKKTQANPFSVVASD
jgi:hypothetical protein